MAKTSETKPAAKDGKKAYSIRMTPTIHDLFDAKCEALGIGFSEGIELLVQEFASGKIDIRQAAKVEALIKAGIDPEIAPVLASADPAMISKVKQALSGNAPAKK